MSSRKPNLHKLEALSRQGTLNPRPRGVTQELFQDSEFFDPRDLVQVKYEMVRRVQVEKESVRQAAAEFGFPRPSFYQAQSALQRQGLFGLVPQKRGPRRAHKLTQEVMDFVEQVQEAQTGLGLSELAAQVQQRFRVQVNPRSIERRLGQRQKKRR